MAYGCWFVDAVVPRPPRWLSGVRIGNVLLSGEEDAADIVGKRI